MQRSVRWACGLDRAACLQPLRGDHTAAAHSPWVAVAERDHLASYNKMDVAGWGSGVDGCTVSLPHNACAAFPECMCYQAAGVCKYSIAVVHASVRLSPAPYGSPPLPTPVGYNATQTGRHQRCCLQSCMASLAPKRVCATCTLLPVPGAGHVYVYRSLPSAHVHGLQRDQSTTDTGTLHTRQLQPQQRSSLAGMQRPCHWVSASGVTRCEHMQW